MLPYAFQAVPPVHSTFLPTVHLVHYHVDFTIMTPGGPVKWFKQYEDAGSKDIWPITPHNAVTDLVATKMHEARLALPPTNHDWRNLGYCTRFNAFHSCFAEARGRLFFSGQVKLPI
jgi:hypothetical protein